MAERKEKLLTVFWSVSMALMGISTAVSSVTNLLGLTMPDMALRVLGAVQLLSLVCLTVSTLQKFRTSAEKVRAAAGKEESHEA